MDIRDLVKKVEEYERIYLYGAGIISGTVYDFLSRRNLIDRLKGFIVTSKKDDVYLDKKIYQVDKVKDKNTLIIVSTIEAHHKDIKNTLNDFNFKNVVFVTASMVDEMVLEMEPGVLLVDEIEKENKSKKEFSIYMAKSHFDKKVDYGSGLPEWIVPIQVGSMLTNENLCAVKDNIGDNISNKNRNYCELTATYWAWKNSSYDYVGLCHYRRHFKLNKTLINSIVLNDVDVVLPIPVVCLPSAKKHHQWYIKDSDFDAMLEVLREYYPDYYEETKNVFNDKLFYCHNMWIMKKTHLSSYCEWLFDILDKVDKIVNPYGNRSDRYIGYLAESLTTLYFRYNKDKLNIRHLAENMIV